MARRCKPCLDLPSAGEMRHTLTFQRPTDQRDAAGQIVVNESADTTVSQIRCKVESASGGEALRGLQVEPTTTHVITTLYTSKSTKLKGDDYAYWRGRRLNITAIRDRTGEGRVLTIEAKAQGV